VDVLLAIAFYFCAGLALLGALLSALLPAGSRWRAPALLALAVGGSGAIACLSAVFAGLVTLICLVAAAILLSGRGVIAPSSPVRAAADPSWLAQLGGLMAAALVILLAYAAVRGDFVRGTYPGGWLGAAALGRVLFSRDAIAVQAVAFTLLIGLSGLAGIGWNRRR
jgi:NADH:ubiquinone oxidoreductase subunit 6 (subunit J)